MRTRILSVMIFFALSLPGLAGESVESSVHIIESVRQGDPFSIVLYPALDLTCLSPSDKEVRLLTSAGRTVSKTVLFSWTVHRDIVVTAAVFGVWSTAAPGVYRIRVGSESAPIAERTVTIVTRDFREERIPLNEAMTTLRSAPNPARDAQTDVLSELLSSIRSEGVFFGDRFSIPVTASPESSPFGSRRVFVYSDGRTSTTEHFGLDFASPVGTPVYAAGAGRVAFAEMRLLTGNTVILEHLPGMYGLYYHLDSLSVKADEFVRSGDLLGLSGKTGLVTGPHLHWEFRIAGVPVEPRALLEMSILDKRSILSIINEDNSRTERR